MKLLVTLAEDLGWIVYDLEARVIVAGPFGNEEEAEAVRDELEKKKINDVRVALDKKLHQSAKVETL